MAFKDYSNIVDDSRKKKNNKKDNSSEPSVGFKDYSSVVEGQRLFKTINMDTFQSDLNSLTTTIQNVYNGWQTPETMNNTRISVQNMYDRIGKYQDYQKKYGGADLSELYNTYGTVLKDWDTLAEEYGRYKNADAHKKETTTLKKLSGMTSSDVEVELNETTDLEDKLKTAKGYESKIKGLTNRQKTWEHRAPGVNVGGVDKELNKVKAEYNQYLKSIGYTSSADIEKALSGRKIAYTTTDGQNILWQDLYDTKKQKEDSAALYKEISSKNDFAWNRNVGANLENPSPDEFSINWAGERIIGPKIQNELEYAMANKEMILLAELNGSRNGNLLYYTHATQEERDIYNYWLGSEKTGTAPEGSAKKYLDSILPSLKKRNDQKMLEGTIRMAEEHSVIASGMSVGMNLFAGAEQVKNSVEYMRTGEMKKNTFAEASSAIRGTVSQKYDLMLGDWDAHDFLYNSSMSMADSVASSAVFGKAGGVVLGLSAAAQGTNDALDRGLDDKSAFWSGLSAGVFEGLFETYSIGKFKALKEAPVDGVKSVIKNVGKSMLVNASEETLTEIANLTYDYFANADMSQFETQVRAYMNSGMSKEEATRKVALEQAVQVGEAGLSGAFMGIGFGGVGGTSAYLNSKRIGSNIKSNSRTGEVFDLASVSPEVSSAYEAYTSYANKGISADNASDAQVGSLWKQSMMDAQEVLNSKKSTAEQKAMANKTISELGIYAQEKSSAKGIKKAIKKAYGKDAESVEALINEGLESSEDTTSYKLATEYKAKIENGEKLTTNEILKLVEANETAIKAETEGSVAERLAELGESSDIADIVTRKIRGEEITLSEAEKLNANENGLQVLGENINEDLVGYVKTMGNDVDANLFTSLYDGKTELDAYANSFNLVTEYAKKDFTYDTILKNKGVLTNAQAVKIYKETRLKTDANKQSIINKLNEEMSKKMAYKGFIDESIIDYGDGIKREIPTGLRKDKGLQENTTKKVKWSDLKPRQRQAITFVKGLAQATGMNLVMTADEKYNGAYDIKDNTIYLDVYAGIDHIERLTDTIIPTMSHELTHWMENKSPELWRKINEVVFSTLQKGDGITEVERIAKEINDQKTKHGRDYSEKEARSEIVARACEDMLSKSEVGKQMFNSLTETEQKTLIDKIKDIVQKLKNWVSDLLSSYESGSREATIMREYQDELNRLSKLWDKMLSEAVVTNQSLEKSGAFGNTIDSIGSKDLSALSDAKGTDGKTLFQYRAIVEDEDIYRDMLLKNKNTIGITSKQIDELFTTIGKAVDIISQNLEALDYAWDVDINDRAFAPVKPNSDSLYEVSLDFSTLCRKRLLQQTIQQTLQNALEKNLSKEESIAIRDELIKIQEEGRKIEVACALCYVESARMKSPKQINKFLNNREAIIREFFANRSGGSIKEKIAYAELNARKELQKANPNGLVGKNGVVLDALTAPKSHMVKKDADYIRNEGKKAKASYKLTEHEQAELDVALKMGVDNFTSAKGLENLAKKHPDLFDVYTSFVRNATHSKGIENDTWWRAGDSDTIGETLIARMNAENGIRSQFWSDFQVIHLLDYVAATIELSTKGAKRQSFTKVPDYVKLLGNTGDMINLSLIPERVFSGKLSYDGVEGMAYDIAKQLRDEYHETAGTICIGIENEQIHLLLEDITIDMVIPYHHSSMSKDTRKLMHIPSWVTYEKYQNEKSLSDEDAKVQAKEYGVELKKDAQWQKAPKFSEWFNLEEARQIANLENENPSNMDAYKKYGKMYGGYMAMQNAANTYLKLCAERGLAPKFSSEVADFTKNANYWKLLIDRKMVDNVTGEIIEQKPIKPIFNEKHILEILNDELARYPQVKADQEYAQRKVVEKFLSGDMKVDKSTLDAIKKPIDNVTEVNILESANDGVLNSDRDSEGNTLTKAQQEYAYETLIAKPDMKLTKINTVREYKPTKELRKNVVDKAIENAKSVGKINENGNVAVFVDDVEKSVVISRKSLVHGLDRRLSENIPATLKVGEILKNAIKINELTPSIQTADGSYVLIGVANNAKGELSVVRFVVNSFSNEVASLDVLYALNTKKESAVLNAPPLTNNSLRITDSTISIAELLDYVNEYFPDILPESVLRHYGYDARPEGKLGENALYSDRVTELTEDDYKNMKNHFGVTGNFNVAGYMLKNGQMLDFSGKHWGDTTSKSRQVDHRDIQEAIPSENNGVDSMVNMISNGNIRLMPEVGGINLSVAPTKNQRAVLRRYIGYMSSKEGIIVDIDRVGGDTIKSFTYDVGVSADRVMRDIDNYFRGGTQSELMRFHTAEGDGVLYSERDSEGNTLTEAQIEYFKGSKARDKNGNLMIVWHGSPESFTIFDTHKDTSSIIYDASFFTSDESRAKAYADKNNTIGYVYKGYVDIKNPLMPSKVREQINLIPDSVKEKYQSEFDIEEAVSLTDYAIIDFAKYVARKENSTMATVLKSWGFDGYMNGNDYAIFEPEQFKDIDNTNPTSDKDYRYSDREDTSVYDLMGEKERLLKENEKFKAEVERLRERLKIEKKVTKGNFFNENQLGSVAGHLRKISNSNIDKVELMKSLKEVYSYIARSENLTWEEVFEKCYNVADAMLEEAKPEVVVDDYSKMILNEIRTTRISLSKEQKKEAEYIFGKNWNRHFFNRVGISDNGIPIDSQWQEWSGLYPDIFEEGLSDGDMIAELDNIINSLRDASETVMEYDMEEQKRWLAREIYNQYWNVSPIRTTADKYDKQIKRLNFEHRKAMAEFREEYDSRMKDKLKSQKEKHKKLVAEIRERKDKEIAVAKERGKERLSQYKENAERKTRIQSITANALSLNDMLVKNSKDKHIPEAMKDTVIELLQAINFSSKRLLEKGVPTQKDIRLANALRNLNVELLEQNSGIKETLDDFYASEIDKKTSELVESVDKIMKTIGDNEFILNKMSAEDLKKLDDVIKIVKSAVNRVNKFHVAQHNAGVESLAIQSTQELKSRKKVYGDNKKHFDKLKTKTYWNNLNPFYAFKNLGDGAQIMFRPFQDGQDKVAFLAKEVIDFAESVYTDKEYKKWSETFFEFNALQKNGETKKFSLNIPQIMSLYCVAKQEDARRHLLLGNEKGDGGGITIVETDKTEAVRNNIMLTEDNLNAIISTLNDKSKVGRAKEVADALQKFMGERGAELGNEISMARWGIKSFGIKDYFPIKVSDGAVPEKGDTPGVQGNPLIALLNMSFTHSRNEFASQSIEIGDIFDVFANHMSSMIQYNAMALPVLDMYKWMNCHGKNENGVEFSVKTSVKDTFGDYAWGYLNTFMKDINGTTKDITRDNLGLKFFRNAKVAKVAFNIRVVALQFTSYIRAGSVVDNKYLLKALVHTPKIKKSEEHCGMALLKSLGYYDTDITKPLTDKIKHVTSVKEKVIDWSLKGAEYADKITLGYLWNACELEVRETRKDLRVGSEEFYKEIGLRLRDIIYRTQVVDSQLTRSQMMRGSSWDKMLTSFASENALSFNLIADIYVSQKLDKRSMGKVEARKKNGKYMRKAITAYVVTNLVTAAIASMFDAFRDYDEDDKDEEYIAKLMLENFINNISFANKLPYINLIISTLSGFTPSRMETDWMNSTSKALKEITQIASGAKGGDVEDLVKYLLKASSDVSGIAGYNIYRDIQAIVEMLND